MVFIKQQTYGNDWGSPSCRMREIPPWETGHSTRPTGDDPTGRQIFFRWFRDSVGEFSWKWYEMMALLEDSPKNHMVLHHFPMKTTMKGRWNPHVSPVNSPCWLILNAGDRCEARHPDDREVRMLRERLPGGSDDWPGWTEINCESDQNDHTQFLVSYG